MSNNNVTDPYDVSVSCLYFNNPGQENTEPTLERVAQRAEELGVNNIVVATTSGETGLAASRLFQSKNVVIVTHSTGFVSPDFQEIKPELRKRIEEHGAKILTCQHTLGGVGRAVRKKLATYQLEEIIAYTLRIFGEGTKVAVEIAVMAADAGLISTKELCIAVGGTGQGADTAILLQPANAQSFFDIKIIEILAKPRLA
ncbi:MAG: pyruvate kinase alpha/beta domain-containing protein [Candidatus Aminicenantaceae bacterium]